MIKSDSKGTSTELYKHQPVIISIVIFNDWSIKLAARFNIKPKPLSSSAKPNLILNLNRSVVCLYLEDWTNLSCIPFGLTPTLQFH